MTTLFVSHGAPTLAIEPGNTGEMLAEVAAALPRPDAILVVSAHWDTRVPTVSLANQPETIHDFAGFPPALYAKQYPAPGAPALAQQVAALLQAQDIAAQAHPQRGLDHGAWVPLMLMYPAADIPVTQLSIQSRSTPAEQFALGRALQGLHEQNVLILASGAITHNLSDFFTADRNAAPLPYVLPFADWMAERIQTQQWQHMFNYRAECPQGSQAHPSEDHLMPLFVAAGSATGEAIRFTPENTYGILAMDAYLWATNGVGIDKPLA
ncbi:class III extradiol ring-cleavage dioxygenase [Methylophilus sp. OH31]|uniref:DODA-type extradiol aromatic ring-opening family dioxygenase n=1 Tax=Methylophilus sp. OH31 TaxID=1387312 RepID=UPI000464DCA7|nr:class III extradiol ring-cleavage dioxygenase [Methylophilus sp. OH31]